MRPESSTLPGRANILAELRCAAEGAVEGRGACVVLEGPGGIGKSRLLETTVAEAAELDVGVAAGRASHLDRAAPLSTLTETLRANPAFPLDLADLPDARSSPLQLIDHLRELVETYTCSNPLVVAVDDAERSDELSALALRMMVPALATAPVFWLLARRPGEGQAQAAIDWLLREDAKRLCLHPLEENDVARLCEASLGAKPDAGVLQLAARCHGNPFLLTELLRTLRTAGQVRTDSGTVTLLADQLPPSFLGIIDQELHDLSDSVRRLLDVGCVLARPFTLHEAAGLMGCSAVDLIPTADQAIGTGVLTATGTDLTFKHELIREAVYSRLAGPVRLTLHREAANVIQTEGGSLVETAEHLIHSGRAGPEHAVEVLQQAAEQLSPTQPGTAADLILRTLGLLGERHPDRPQLAAYGVRLLARVGRIDDSRKLGEQELHPGLTAGAEAKLLLGLSEALKHAGQNAAVVDYTRRALSRPDLPDGIRAELLSVQAHGLLYAGDTAAADVSGAEAAAVGQKVGEHAAVVFGTVARSIVSRTRGELDAALAYAREAVQLADSAGGEASQRHPRLWLGHTLIAVDQFTEADADYHTGQQEANQLETAWSQPLWHYHRSALRMAAGRLSDAEAEAHTGIRVAEQLTALALKPALLAMLARVAFERDDLTEARDRIEQAQRLVAGGVSAGPEELAWVGALLHTAHDHHMQAMKALECVYSGLPERPVLLTQDVRAAAELVRIALQCGARTQAQSVVTVSGELAQRNPNVTSLAGAAAHAQGLLDGNPELLHAAVQAYRSSPRPLARADALEDTARAEKMAGNRNEAVLLFEESLREYEACGAWRAIARVTKELGRSRHGRGRSTTGWHALTESELRVARLVAEGLTNREVARQLFLSPHTVDSHLRHSFQKLGVTTRVQLTRHVAVHERGE